MFLSERNFSPRVRRGVFRPKSRVSPRCVTAGRTLERRHCLPGLHQHRVEVTAASALPSDLHRQLDDRRGDLRQCLNALCPEFRFGHGGLSRFGFERCHGSSGAVPTVCVLAGAALVQSPVVRPNRWRVRPPPPAETRHGRLGFRPANFVFEELQPECELGPFHRCSAGTTCETRDELEAA